MSMLGTDLESASLKLTHKEELQGSYMSQAELLFLETLTGNKRKLGEKSPEDEYLFMRMNNLISRHCQCSHEDQLHGDFAKHKTTFERLLLLCCALMRVHRLHQGVSMHKLVLLLQKDSVLRNADQPNDKGKQEHLVFSAIGWITALYIPSEIFDPLKFRVESERSRYPSRGAVDAAKALRPVDELLRGLGETLRCAADYNTAHTEIEPFLKFHVSSLNVATLQSLAKVEVRWVDTISAHLDFDASVPAIYIFRAPSMCELQSSEDSILAVLTRDVYFESKSMSEEFTIPNLMKETVLSYRLLFGDDRVARKIYRQERANAGIIGKDQSLCVDPVLDKCCGFELPISMFSSQGPLRETYHAESDFPLLKRRLLKIHNYMNGIQPSRLSSLWEDKRDLRLWYTLWAVIIFGSISIIQSFISIFLAAAQVALAEKALQVQNANNFK